MTIQEILEDLKVDFVRSGNPHCRPGWVQLRRCPFCGSDKYHLGINLQQTYAACWKCGGHHLAFLFQELGLSRDEAWKTFKGVNTQGIAPKRERHQISCKEPAGRGPLQANHRAYLEERRFDPDQIQKIWGIEGIGISSRLSWRLYIPVYLRAEKVSWTARSISSEAKQRYISASADEEKINHKELLYGGDYCSHSVVVCEGPTDVWRIGPGAVALFGTAFSIAQVNKLRKIPNRFVCFDNEDTAQEKAEDLCNQLSCFPGTTENIVLDAEDPGEASEKEVKLLRKVARL